MTSKGEMQYRDELEGMPMPATCTRRGKHSMPAKNAAPARMY